MALYGKHIFDDAALRQKGLDIVRYLSEKTAEWKNETGYGFSLYSTPAESLCYRFANWTSSVSACLKELRTKAITPTRSIWTWPKR
ncbi:hypothetical protein HMSSN036_19630 [Paenibacillus macerans]|nr:hypothetical protein HMSSN036_19630 [Paenibacillus macerans]